MIFEHPASTPGYRVLPATACPLGLEGSPGHQSSGKPDRGMCPMQRGCPCCITEAAPARSPCSGTLAGVWAHGLFAAGALGERCANKQKQGRTVFLRKLAWDFPFSHSKKQAGKIWDRLWALQRCGGVHPGSLGRQGWSRQDGPQGSGLQLKSLRAAKCLLFPGESSHSRRGLARCLLLGTARLQPMTPPKAHSPLLPSTPSPQRPSSSYFLPSLLFVVPPPPPCNPLTDMARPGISPVFTHLIAAL